MPDTAPHPRQSMPSPGDFVALVGNRYGMRIGQCRDFELKDIIRLQPHAKIDDNNIPFDRFRGIKAMGKPLQAPDGPMVFNPCQQVTVKGVPAQRYLPCGIEYRVEALVVVAFISDKNPP